jgi:hypothetical protein
MVKLLKIHLPVILSSGPSKSEDGPWAGSSVNEWRGVPESFEMLFRITTSALGRSNAREVTKKSRDLKVGDVLKVRKNQRLPADVVILKSISNDSGTPRPATFL